MRQLPACQNCNLGQMLPLSDYGPDGASIHFKGWVCSNPACLFNLVITRGGDIVNNQPVYEGRE